MGNVLLIPNADFTNNKIHTSRTQKIEFSDDDKVYGFFSTDISYVLKDIYLAADPSPTSYVISKFNSDKFVYSSATYANNAIGYVIDIPQNAIGVGGLIQVPTNRAASSPTLFVGTTAFANRDGVIPNNEYLLENRRDVYGGLETDTYNTLLDKIASYNATNKSGIKYIKNLGIYDNKLFGINDTNEWISGVFDVVFKIPQNALYFCTSFLKPVRLQMTNIAAGGSTFNIGFTESHLYWIFE